jgi:predicted metal-dependent phosphoesterase TrpH
MFEYDLHVHTTASDGVYTPAEMIQLAIESGLKGIAITDHDTVDGLRELKLSRLKLLNQIELVPGIEINTDFEEEEVHILGYFIDFGQPQLLSRLEALKAARKSRADKIIGRLHNLGIEINRDRVQEIAGSGAIGRPHIARAMIESGYGDSIKQVFDHYLKRGGPAYVPRYRLLPEEAIALIKDAGGTAILAHPGLINKTPVIDKVLKMGIQGLEIFYPEHTLYQIYQLLHLTLERKLLITGGSDFHGTENSRNQLGLTGLDSDRFQQFVEKIKNCNYSG